MISDSSFITKRPEQIRGKRPECADAVTESAEAAAERNREEWKVLGRLLKEAILPAEQPEEELIASVITSDHVVTFLNDEQTPEQRQKMRYTAMHLDPDTLKDTVPVINTETLMTAIRNLSDTELQETEAYAEMETLLGDIATSAYDVSEIITTKNGKNEKDAKTIFKVAQNLGRLMEKTDLDEETSIAIQTLYAKLLVQGLRTQQEFGGRFVSEWDRTVHHQYDETEILHRAEAHMCGNSMRTVGARLMLMRSLSQLPYVHDIDFTDVNDERGRGSHISFRIDPKRSGNSNVFNKVYLKMIGDAKMFVTVQDFDYDQHGPVTDGFLVSIVLDKHSETEPAIYCDLDDERCNVRVSIDVDAAFKRDITVPFSKGSISFSSFDFGAFAKSAELEPSGLPEAFLEMILQKQKKYASRLN
ncbi:MAG: hypothetical protein WCL23_00355 [Candidatus Moraniibacteriota bacterium]